MGTSTEQLAQCVLVEGIKKWWVQSLVTTFFTFCSCSTFPPYCSTSVRTSVRRPSKAAFKMAVCLSCRHACGSSFHVYSIRIYKTDTCKHYWEDMPSNHHLYYNLYIKHKSNNATQNTLPNIIETIELWFTLRKICAYAVHNVIEAHATLLGILLSNHVARSKLKWDALTLRAFVSHKFCDWQDLRLAFTQMVHQ